MNYYKLIAKKLRAMADELEKEEAVSSQEKLLRENPEEFFKRLKEIRSSKIGEDGLEMFGSFNEMNEKFKAVARDFYSRYEEDCLHPDQIPILALDEIDAPSAEIIEHSFSSLYPGEEEFAKWETWEAESGMGGSIYTVPGAKYGWWNQINDGAQEGYLLVGFSTLKDLENIKSQNADYPVETEITDLLNDIKKI